MNAPVDQVRLSVLEAIASGRLKPGDRLLSEIEQARGFRVSRTAVREALRSLAEIGLITTVQGRGGGSFVNRLDAAPAERNLRESIALRLHFDAVALSEVLEARRALERVCAEIGATRRAPQPLDEIAVILERARDDTLSWEEWLELDIRFHRAVARSANNRVLIVPLAALHAVVQPQLNEASRHCSAAPESTNSIRTSTRRSAAETPKRRAQRSIDTSTTSNGSTAAPGCSDHRHLARAEIMGANR